jgi:hypothetical protein
MLTVPSSRSELSPESWSNCSLNSQTITGLKPTSRFPANPSNTSDCCDLPNRGKPSSRSSERNSALTRITETGGSPYRAQPEQPRLGTASSSPYGTTPDSVRPAAIFPAVARGAWYCYFIEKTTSINIDNMCIEFNRTRYSNCTEI